MIAPVLWGALLGLNTGAVILIVVRLDRLTRRVARLEMLCGWKP